MYVKCALVHMCDMRWLPMTATTHATSAEATLAAASDELLEKVLLEGDLSKLSVPQRLAYYKHVCESVGLNPLTKPFDYVKLQGKLTLYARKDATDQLRKLHGVSVDDLELTRSDGLITACAKGSDRTGRRDVEYGSVAANNLKGDALANAEMKAVTKAKRRLTLSMCGLGWLDETEVRTIPDAEPVDEMFHEEQQADVEQPAAPAAEEERGHPPAPTSQGDVPISPEEAAEEEPHYFRYLKKCQELKADLGDDAYYDVLDQFDLRKSNEVNGSDLKKMGAIVKSLMAVSQLAKNGIV